MKYTKEFMLYVLDSLEDGMKLEDMSNETFLAMCEEVWLEEMEEATYAQ